MPFNKVEPDPLHPKKKKEHSLGSPSPSRKKHGVDFRGGVPEMITSSKIYSDKDRSSLGDVSMKSATSTLHGHSIRELLPQVMNEQNRKTYGTWQRKFDFGRTIIGYLLGIHNFFRFPYLCYKYGGVFILCYIVMMFVVGIPTVFMEFTIGQYYGVGSYVAFTHMSPILSCVSKILTWSCVVNCWMYTVILAWLRIYAADATSCLKGWEICEQDHYYNSPHCWTGLADDFCNDPMLAQFNNMTESDVLSQDLLYFNFKCTSVDHFCRQHGWDVVPGKRKCADETGKEHSIYDRRYHAIQEYLYGAVLGLQRNMEENRTNAMINETIIVSNSTDINGLHVMLNEEKREENSHADNATEIELVRTFVKMLKLSRDEEKLTQYYQILENVAGPKYQQEYWTKDNQKLSECVDSSSYIILQHVSVTTWIMIAVFLFEDLLKVSFLSYVLNAFPFVILIYLTLIAVSFPYAWTGFLNIFETRDGFFDDLANFDMWAEAVVQVIYTSGIGTGVLISLATFNNFNNGYLFDLYCTLTLSLIASFCGVLITFCTIGHYIKHYDIDVRFEDYIKSDASTSSVEFCFIAYSHFLTLINARDVSTILFFFMVTSFATDTAIRLVQNVLDAVIAIHPRLQYHSTMVLVAICSMGYLILVPVMKNGGIIFFIDFEYFVMQYMIPTILLIEIGTTVFLYKPSRLVDHAEQMGVFRTYAFRVFITALMYFAFAAVLCSVVVNLLSHQRIRFNETEAETVSEIFGWVFFITPFIMATLSVVKQLVIIPTRRWKWLLVPLMGKDRKVRRAFLRRVQGDRQKNQGETEATDQEQIRAVAAKMRILESRFILAMMQQRREEQEKKRLAELENINGKGSASAHTAPAPTSALPPLFASLVRVAAAEFGATTKQRKSNYNYLDGGSSKKLKEDTSSTSLESRRSVFKLKKYCTLEQFKKCFRRKTEKKVNETQDDIEERKEIQRLEYVDMMDHIERWPGRLDESEIESEGSSETEDEDEDENAY